MLSELEQINQMIEQTNRITQATRDHYKSLQNKAYYNERLPEMVISFLKRGRKVIGVAACWIDDLAPGDRGISVTRDLIIVVNDRYRDQGYGTSLLESLIKEIEHTGRKTLLVSKIATDNLPSRSIFENVDCKISHVAEKTRSSGNYLQLTYSRILN